MRATKEIVDRKFIGPIGDVDSHVYDVKRVDAGTTFTYIFKVDR